jgi:uncharacterized protein
MKLLAFTDIHDDMAMLSRIKMIIARERVDLAVCMGDFTVFGRGMKRMLQGMDNLGVPLVLIHGNHEDEEEILSLLKSCKNIHWAHERVVDIKGLRFIGFGGHGFRRREPGLEVLEKRLAKEFNDRTIFLCHAPPHGTTADEVDEDWHVGNQSLTELIKRRRPLLALCGHIHETFHAHDNIAGTIIINPGPDGEILDIDNE